MTKKPRGATITEHASIMNTSTKPFISVWSHPHARKEVITTRLFWSVLAVPSAPKGKFSSQNSRNVTTTEHVKMAGILVKIAINVLLVQKGSSMSMKLTNVIIIEVALKVIILMKQFINVWLVHQEKYIIWMIRSAITTEHAYIMNTSMKPFINVWSHPHARKESIIIQPRIYVLAVLLVQKDKFSSQNSRNVTTTQLVKKAGIIVKSLTNVSLVHMVLSFWNKPTNVTIIEVVHRAIILMKPLICVQCVQKDKFTFKMIRSVITTEHASIMNTSTKPFISVWSHPHARKEVITTRLFWSVLAVPSALKGKFSSQNSRNVTTTELV